IEEERKAFNEQFGIDDANTFPALGDGIDSSAVLKCNWLGWVRCAEQKQAEIKSLKSELAKAQAVPEGFVLVPKEPTLEMIAKGHDVFVGAFDSKLNGGQSLHCAYLAMI